MNQLVISSTDLDLCMGLIMFGFGFLGGLFTIGLFARGFQSNAR